MRKRMKFKDVWLESGHLRIGLCMIGLVTFCAIFASVIEPYNPYRLGDALKAAPSAEHWLGTDSKGRDVFSMVIEGSRTSLTVGVVAALISGLLGTLIGGTAGFLGGRTDAWVSEGINIFLMLPTFFLILITVALFGSSMMNVMVIIGLTSWPGNARLMRVQALTLKERTFVRSAQALGESRSSLLFRYIIPNGIFPVVTNTAMGIAGAILTEAGLSFLGLGDPNVISWGQMVYEGRGYMTSAWWVSTFAGLAIVVTVLGVYLCCDGLNRVLNPKSPKPR